MSEEEVTIDIPEALEVEKGAYLVEISKMSLIDNKKGIRNIVIESEITEGPYTGARVNDWISQDKGLPFNVQQMNTNKLNHFMVACADGDTDFDRKIKFTRDEEDQLRNTAVEGLVIGVYLRTNNGYLNVDRESYFPASEYEATDEAPF